MQIELIEGSVSVHYFPFWRTEKKMCSRFSFKIHDQQFQRCVVQMAIAHVFRQSFNIWWLNSQTRFNRSRRLASCLIFHWARIQMWRPMFTPFTAKECICERKSKVVCVLFSRREIIGKRLYLAPNLTTELSEANKRHRDVIIDGAVKRYTERPEVS